MGKILKKYNKESIFLSFNSKSSSKEFLYLDLISKGISLKIKDIGIDGNIPFLIIDCDTPESITVDQTWKFFKDKNTSKLWKKIKEFNDLLELKFPEKESFKIQKNFCINIIEKFEEAEAFLNYILALKENDKSLPAEIFSKSQLLLDQIKINKKKMYKIEQALNKRLKLYKKQNYSYSYLFYDKAMELLEPELIQKIHDEIKKEIIKE